MKKKRYRHAPGSIKNRIKEMFLCGSAMTRKHLLEKFIEEDELRKSLSISNVHLHRDLYLLISSRVSQLCNEGFIKFYCMDPSDPKNKMYIINAVEPND